MTPAIALLTRFSVRSEKFMAAAGIRSEADRAQWFALRAALFKSITLPSIRAQTLRPTRWYLLMAEGDQELFDKHIGATGADWIVPAYVPHGPVLGAYCQRLLGTDFARSQGLFVSRLDNDDAVDREYFRCMVDAARDAAIDEDHYLVFKRGCRWDGAQLQVLDYPNNPFLTVYAPRWHATRPNPLVMNHSTVGEHRHVFADPHDARPMWLQTLHGANASNRFVPQWPRVDADFGRLGAQFAIQPESIEAIDVNRETWTEEPVVATEEPAAAPAVATPPVTPSQPPALDPRTARARRLNTVRNIIGARSYLEIGVCTGATFFAIDAPRKVGVDPRFRFDIAEQRDERSTFFQMTSTEYFVGPGADERFDLVFVDGLHTFEQTLIDFNAALMMSHPGSAIVIDDTVPSDVFGSLPDQRRAFGFRRKAGSKSLAWHGDVFKLVVYIRDFLPMLSYCTFNTGGNQQTLVWRQPRTDFKPVCGNLEAISRLDYFWLMEHLEVMNPVPEPQALELLQSWARRRKE